MSQPDFRKLDKVYQYAKGLSVSVGVILYAADPHLANAPDVRRELFKRLDRLPRDIAKLDNAIQEADDLLPRGRVEIAGHLGRNLPAALSVTAWKLLHILAYLLTPDPPALLLPGEDLKLDTEAMIENWGRMVDAKLDGALAGLCGVKWAQLPIELDIEAEAVGNAATERRQPAPTGQTDEPAPADKRTDKPAAADGNGPAEVDLDENHMKVLKDIVKSPCGTTNRELASVLEIDKDIIGTIVKRLRDALYVHREGERKPIFATDAGKERYRRWLIGESDPE